MDRSRMAAAAPRVAALALLLACGKHAAPGGAAPCRPLTCAATDTCGVLVDGCGGTVSCPCQETKAARCDPPSADFCSDDGFCWLTPVPQGDDLLGIWGARDDAVWAAGPGGAMLVWDGGRWLRVALPEGANANAIWGTAADDAWAVGSAILHWDGRCWTDVRAPVPEGGLAQVHGTGPRDVWASGKNGLLHYDGTAWSVAAPGGPPASGLLALAPDRVLAGTRASIFAWDGARWTETRLGYDVRDVPQLWAAAPDDVWAAAVIEPPRCYGAACPTSWQALFHFDGAAWSRAGPALAAPTFHAVSGTSASDVWAFSDADAWHWDGAAWTSRPLPRRPGQTWWTTAIRAARLEPGGRGWAVGDAGEILRLDGGAWLLAGGFGPVGMFRVATGTSERDAWFGPTGLGASPGESVDLLHWDGSRLVRVPTGFDGIIYSAWAAAPGDVWANTYGKGLLHLEGDVWTAGALGTTGTLTDVLGFGADDVYWVEQLYDGTWFNLARLWHWNGSTVTSQELPPGGWEHVSGTGSLDLWLTGSGCQGCATNAINDVAHLDGTRWTILTIPGEDVAPERAWSDGNGSAWIVGYPGLVAHAGPDGVTRLPAFGTGAVEAIVGGGPSDLWAFGWFGLALHHDGRTWAPRASGTRQWLMGAWRSPAGEVFVAGTGGAVLRRAAVPVP